MRNGRELYLPEPGADELPRIGQRLDRLHLIE
jgi:hypothetical protein